MMTWPIRALLNRLSPDGRSARLSILIYHRVHAQPDPLFPGEVDAARFARQIMVLSQLFNVLPLPEAVHRLREGTLPQRAACVTFDDGYADNAEVALPILEKHAVPATFFIASAYLDGGRMWNDEVIESVRRSPLADLDLSEEGLGCHSLSSLEHRRQAIGNLIGQLKYLPEQKRTAAVKRVAEAASAALPDDLMMHSEQVRLLHRAGMTIGGHTATHPILARLAAEDALDNIRQGKARLEEIVNEPLRVFAYPNGKPGEDYRAEHVAMAREAGFEAAVSTAWGVSIRNSDPFQLPRFTPWDRTEGRFAFRLARNLLRTEAESI